MRRGARDIIVPASAAGTAATAGDGYNIIAAGTQTANTTGTVVFSNSNNVTFGMTNNSIVTASVTVATSLTNIRVSAGATSNLLSALTFADSNGVSFGINASTLTATVKTDYQSSNANYLTSQSNQNVTASNGGFAFQTLSFSNANGVSFGTSAGSAIIASYTVPTVTNSSWTVSDNGTSGTVARLAFTNLNGITLSLSSGAGGSHTIVGSYTVPTQSNQTVGLYASSNTTGESSSSTFDARSISFIGKGVASVGFSGSQVVISVPSGGGAGDGGNTIAAGTRTATTSGVVLFSNANGITFGLDNVNGSIVTASYTVPTVTNSSWTVSDSATSATVGRLAFTASNGLTLTLSTSNNGNHTVIGSYTVPTVTNSSMTVSDAATSGTLARLAFTNLNGVTLSLSSGAGGSHTIVGSHNALTSQSNQAFSAAGGASNFQTLSFSDNGYVSWTNNAGQVAVTTVRGSFFAASNTTQGTSGTQNLNAVSFNGAGIVSVGVSNGSVVVSDPAPASLWFNGLQVQGIGTAQGNSLVSIFPVQVQWPLVVSQAKIGGNFAIATTTNNSSAYIDVTMSLVFYTLNGRSLSSLFSASASMTQSWSSNATASASGVQQFTASFAATTLVPNVYYMAAHVSTNNTATGGANTTALGNTISMIAPGLAPGTAGIPMRVFRS
jgi:hypothetical protein